MNFLKIFSDGFQDNWDNSALTDLDKGLTLSYGDLASCIQRMHMLLEALGVRQGTRIAVVGRNSIDWITCYLGAITYGATVITMPPFYDGDEMISLLADVGTEYLFIDRGMYDTANVNLSFLPMIKFVVSIDTMHVLACRHGAVKNAEMILSGIDQEFVNMYPYGFTPDCATAPVLSPDSVVAIFFTSGTMGRPRPVMLMADNLEGNIIYGIKAALHPRHSSAVTSTTLGTVWGTIFNLLVPLSSGAHLSVFSDVKNPAAMVRAFMQAKPRRLMISTLVMSRFYDYVWQVHRNKRTMRWLSAIPGGNKMVARLMRLTMGRMLGGRCQEVIVGYTKTGPSLSYRLRQAGVHFTVVYGLTECGGLVGYVPASNYRVGTSGRTLGSLVRCRIRPVDYKGLPEKAGVLEVKGMTVMKGYAGEGDMAHAPLTSDGWLSTGDIATISHDGDLTIIGRIDTLIHLDRGVVVPEHLQSILYEMPQVAHAIVVGRAGKLTAIIHPDYDAINEMYSPGVIDVDRLIHSVIAEVNRTTSLIEHIDEVEVSHEPLKLTCKGTVARYHYC